MQKYKKIIISVILLISITLSLASCGLFLSSNKRPEGYTGGFGQNEPHFYGGKEIHWLETFGEVMEAIEHLEAAGNKIPKTILSSYENELVDAKYCIHFSTYGSKRLKRGQKWYDREQINGLRIFYCGFLDKMTIEELEYSNYQSYRCLRVSSGDIKYIDPSMKITYMCAERQDLEEEYEYMNVCWAVVESTKKSVARTWYINTCCTEFPENFHEEFIKSIVYIGEE